MSIYALGHVGVAPDAGLTNPYLTLTCLYKIPSSLNE